MLYDKILKVAKRQLGAKNQSIVGAAKRVHFGNLKDILTTGIPQKNWKKLIKSKTPTQSITLDVAKTLNVNAPLIKESAKAKAYINTVEKNRQLAERQAVEAAKRYESAIKHEANLKKTAKKIEAAPQTATNIKTLRDSLPTQFKSIQVEKEQAKKEIAHALEVEAQNTLPDEVKPKNGAIIPLAIGALLLIGGVL